MNEATGPALALGLAVVFFLGLRSHGATGAGAGGSSSLAAPAPTPIGPSWTRYDALFQKYGAAHRVDWQWLKAICMNESSLGDNPRVAAGQVSYDGKSWGIMQLTLPTANDFESVTYQDLNDPETSVRIAAKFLRWVTLQFSVMEPRYGEWVVKSYNQGVGNTKKEMAGLTAGYAGEYWERFQRNLARVKAGG